MKQEYKIKEVFDENSKTIQEKSKETFVKTTIYEYVMITQMTEFLEQLSTNQTLIE